MQTRLFSILGIAALTLAASTAGPAATRAETTTYVDGNLAGVSPNTGGTLLFSDDKAMYFRTGLSNVPVPYSNISHVELGATKETSHDIPMYKVWALHKRFSGKTETQLLIVNFKNEEGEEKNMTLELAKNAASGVLSAIQTRTGKDFTQETVASSPGSVKTATPEKPANSWWGDDFWKTTRNSDKWSAKAPAATANNDQR